MDIGQVTLILVALFCFLMCGLIVATWTAKDLEEQDRYRYYRGIDLHKMPSGSITDRIKWLKMQEPTDGGLRISDTTQANRVILAYERHGSKPSQ